MQIHERIHRGKHPNGRGRRHGPHQRREHVVTQTLTQLGEGIGTAWRDQHQIGPPPQLDVQDGITHLVPCLPFVLVRPHMHAWGLIRLHTSPIHLGKIMHRE